MYLKIYVNVETGPPPSMLISTVAQNLGISFLRSVPPLLHLDLFIYLFLVVS